jgi:hypothetical protein
MSSFHNNLNICYNFSKMYVNNIDVGYKYW